MLTGPPRRSSPKRSPLAHEQNAPRARPRLRTNSPSPTCARPAAASRCWPRARRGAPPGTTLSSTRLVSWTRRSLSGGWASSSRRPWRARPRSGSYLVYTYHFVCFLWMSCTAGFVSISYMHTNTRAYSQRTGVYMLLTDFIGLFVRSMFGSRWSCMVV